MKEKLNRIWYYFRTGYAIYIVGLLNIANFITIQYQLLLKNTIFSSIFTNMYLFVMFATPLLLFFGVLAGYFHRRFKQLQTEMSIAYSEIPQMRELMGDV